MDLLTESKLYVAGVLGIEPDEVTYDGGVMRKAVEGSFFAPDKRRFYVASPVQGYQSYLEPEYIRYMGRDFGYLLDAAELKPFVDSFNERERVGKKPLLVSDFESAVAKKLAHYVAWARQRNSLLIDVDMAMPDDSPPRVSLVPDSDDGVRVTYSHQKFSRPEMVGNVNQLVVDDFKAHFANCGCEFDEWLEWLVACRFAGDRKQAFMWLHAPSDWGKGLLIGALTNLRLVTEVSVKAVEKIFEGGPVGFAGGSFFRSWILLVDEFKYAKSEVKQLQNTMRVSPKNQLQVEVELYAKLFTSAEHVPSFAGDQGIEDQFARRFSYLQGEGVVTDRSVFKEVGKVPYRQALEAYIAVALDEFLEVYREDPTGCWADDYLEDFHKKHGIGRAFNTLNENLESFAEEFVEWITEKVGSANVHVGSSAGSPLAGKVKASIHFESNDEWLITNQEVLIDAWIDASFDRQAAGGVRHKKTQIGQLVSEGTDRKKRLLDDNQNRIRVRARTMNLTLDQRLKLYEAYNPKWVQVIRGE